MAWDYNVADETVTVVQTAQNSYPGVTLDSYEVMWFDDYVDALWQIPEHQLLYASVDEMVASNTFNYGLYSDGDLKGSTGWTLHMNGAEFGDETVENNGGFPGFDYVLWTQGIEAMPTLTHDVGLVDVDGDDAVDYVLQVSTNQTIVYGVGHEGGSTFTQPGGALSFVPVSTATSNGATYEVLIAAGLAASNSTKAAFEASSWIASDADAHLDWQEYIAGTDPSNAASVFTIGIESNAVVFATVSNRNYAVRTAVPTGDQFSRDWSSGRDSRWPNHDLRLFPGGSLAALAAMPL